MSRRRKGNPDHRMFYRRQRLIMRKQKQWNDVVLPRSTATLPKDDRDKVATRIEARAFKKEDAAYNLHRDPREQKHLRRIALKLKARVAAKKEGGTFADPRRVA